MEILLWEFSLFKKFAFKKILKSPIWVVFPEPIRCPASLMFFSITRGFGLLQIWSQRHSPPFHSDATRNVICTALKPYLFLDLFYLPQSSKIYTFWDVFLTMLLAIFHRTNFLLSLIIVCSLNSSVIYWVLASHFPFNSRNAAVKVGLNEGLL